VPDGRTYWCREYLCATFVAHGDEVPSFNEAWPFSSDAMCNEGRVLFGFRFGRAFMSHEIVGANLSDSINKTISVFSVCSCDKKFNTAYVAEVTVPTTEPFAQAAPVYL
jgi:hypothetical protein